MGEGRGCLCNVWLLFYGYSLVSGVGRYFVESKFNYKICRYIKTYFSLYDLSFTSRNEQLYDCGNDSILSHLGHK
jgi:hypothetical protein